MRNSAFRRIAAFTVLCTLPVIASGADAAVRLKPDLVVSAATSTPTSITAGTAASVKATVRNSGRARAGGSTTSVWLSRDARRNTGDRKLASKAMLSIRVGRTSAAFIRVVVPAGTPAGARYLLACADQLRRVAESNEANNCRAVRIIVKARPATSNTTTTTTTTTTTPTPTPTPTPPVDPRTVDHDGDGITEANGDCRPTDGASFPGAADDPDLSYLDSNCDGIDGNKAGAIFVSTSGSDFNTGEISQPKATIASAILAAASSEPDKDVYVSGGVHSTTDTYLAANVSIYGGYDGATWSRPTLLSTVLQGTREGLLVSNPVDVTLQLLELRAVGDGAATRYGIRIVGGATVTLENVTARAAAGANGLNGTPGATGTMGANGISGTAGCDATLRLGGQGGFSPARPGGAGGSARSVYPSAGSSGSGGTGGGAPGTASDLNGRNGNGGVIGASGAHGASGAAAAALLWASGNGGSGSSAAYGTGGGGGGAGYGYLLDMGFLGRIEYTGGSGGGGGAGGAGGAGALGGTGGGGSFGAYVHGASTLRLLGTTTFIAGNGGNGGFGGNGGTGGPGGSGASGGTPYCGYLLGNGGRGGNGGPGGRGGGGAGGNGGPSIAVRVIGSSLVGAPTSTTFGSGGTGGAGGSGTNAATAAPSGTAGQAGAIVSS